MTPKNLGGWITIHRPPKLDNILWLRATNDVRATGASK